MSIIFDALVQYAGSRVQKTHFTIQPGSKAGLEIGPISGNSSFGFAETLSFAKSLLVS